MSKKKKGKLRADFRKNRGSRPRERNFSRELAGSDSPVDAPHGERASGKGDISRKRTLAGGEVVEDESGTHVLPDVDRPVCRLGRVLRVQGFLSLVRDEENS